MKALEGGKSVIGTKMMKNGDSIVEVEVIYGDETHGFLRTQNGELKKAKDDQYQEVLASYREKESREERYEDIVNEPEPAVEETASEPEEDGNAIVKTGSTSLAEKKKLKEASKIDRKKLLIPFIIVCVVVLAIIILLVVKTFMKKGTTTSAVQTEQVQETVPDEITVAALKNRVASGQIITVDDFEPAVIDRDTYLLLSRTMYIGKDGLNHEGTVLLWDEVGNYENFVALRDLDAGTVAMADDFSMTRSSLSGQMTLRLVAIISSDSLNEDIVCELGQYVVGAGNLQDILNSQGESVLDSLYSQSETQVTAETVVEEAETAGAEVETDGQVETSESEQTQAEQDTGSAEE